MKHSPELSRRRFLQSAVTTAGVASVPVALTGCFGDDDNNSSHVDQNPIDQNPVVEPVVPTDVAFGYGIASGDPLADSVIVWTRATPLSNSDTKAVVSYKVSRTAAMDDVVAEGIYETDASKDFTVKIDVTGLAADTEYFYQFGGANDVVTVVGKTRTLPVGSVDKVTMAVCSCSNFPSGLFNAYNEIAMSDADVVLHLGDYIYEYGPNTYPSQDADGRQPEPTEEIISLEQYRARYAQYRTDVNLQKAHANKPFICVWDDHEVANDTYDGGAENHNEGEGNFADRSAAAFQAYHEWLPIRTGDDRRQIYRRFDFGDLVRLHMLDTRVVARTEQLSYANYLTPTGIDATAFAADMARTDRTLLGADQHGWMAEGMRTSSATWDVLGQQVLMGRMNVPAELLLALAALTSATPDQLPAAQAAIGQALVELATIKTRMLMGDPTLTDAEKARVLTVAPYNLDAWDGYFVSREMVLTAAAAYDRNLVVLAGDTHNAWANNLYAADASGAIKRDKPIGVEFATQSISSPGLEEYTGFGGNATAQAQFEQAIQLLVDDLEYLNAANRGFMKVTFTAAEATAEWIYVSTITETSYTASVGRTLKTLPGANNRTLVEGLALASA